MKQCEFIFTLHDELTSVYCSCCHKKYDDKTSHLIVTWKYCPNCGAKITDNHFNGVRRLMLPIAYNSGGKLWS
jgi:NAD-dependent SIR2 family protein deacetylase